MKRTYTVSLTGENASETARVLVRRLAETGRNACPPDRDPPEAFEGVALRLDESAPGGPADETVAVSPHDTPDFAAEKIVDLLGDRGLISLEPDGYTPEEEEAIRQRLADLGYIE